MSTARWVSQEVVLRSTKLPVAIGRKFLAMFFAEVVRRCLAGESVYLPGLGVLKVVTRASRRIRDIHTGEVRILPETKQLVLRSSKA